MDTLLRDHGLIHADLATYRKALEPYIGGRLRWRLHSWGGEVSCDGSLGRLTPDGRLANRVGPWHNGRIRFISMSLGPKADLETVEQAGYPVVACLAKWEEGETFSERMRWGPWAPAPSQFIRDDALVKRTPEQGEDVIVEATLWGALGTRDKEAEAYFGDHFGMEGNNTTDWVDIWLRDCAVVPP